MDESRLLRYTIRSFPSDETLNVEPFLEALRAWGEARPDILGIALVGSHARGTAQAGSDVDLVVLCNAPTELLDPAWASTFGAIESSIVEDYGALKSLRVLYRSGLEVELGLAAEAWAHVPLDPGTRRVLAGGVRVLYDPHQLFRIAKEAAVA